MTRISKANDYSTTGRWTVKTRHTRTGEETEATFDAIMVCTGHHVKPLVPKFVGQEKFNGKIVHTHSYKKPIGFEGQNVVVVGCGNSGGDAAAELSVLAKQVSSKRRDCTIYSLYSNLEFIIAIIILANYSLLKSI